MVGVDDQSHIDKIHREAETRDIELDRVKVISGGGVGTTFRVLETDADDEVDQVGFDITHPGGPTGDMMFTNRLSQSFSALREVLSGADIEDVVDDPDHEPESDADLDAETEHTGAGTVEDRALPEADPDEILSNNSTADELDNTSDDQMVLDPNATSVTPPSSTSRSKTHGLDMTITIDIDDEQLEEFVETVEDVVDEAVDEVTRDAEEIDKLEARIERLESALAGLANLSISDADESEEN